MKKITFVLTFLAIIGANAKICAADSYKYTPYVGVGYSFDKIQTTNLRPEYSSLNVYVGSDYSNILARKCFLNKVQAVKTDKRRIN